MLDERIGESSRGRSKLALIPEAHPPSHNKFFYRTTLIFFKKFLYHGASGPSPRLPVNPGQTAPVLLHPTFPAIPDDDVFVFP
jgi:hypothetical protein